MVNNYEWLKLIPSGWVQIARQMIDECLAIYPEWEILDLKEKWGALRCYDDSVPSEFRDKIDEIIRKTEKISATTCCVCGAPATKISTGWYLPWCDECGKDEERLYSRL